MVTVTLINDKKYVVKEPIEQICKDIDSDSKYIKLTAINTIINEIMYKTSAYQFMVMKSAIAYWSE